MAADTTTTDCPKCEGDGYTMAVYGQLDTIEECPMCHGAGYRFGRGRTKPTPETTDVQRTDRDALLESAFCGDEAASEALADDVCDYAGHEWLDAGGGLEICTGCAAERWSYDA